MTANQRLEIDAALRVAQVDLRRYANASHGGGNINGER